MQCTFKLLSETAAGIPAGSLYRLKVQLAEGFYRLETELPHLEDMRPLLCNAPAPLTLDHTQNYGAYLHIKSPSNPQTFLNEKGMLSPWFSVP